MVLPMLTWCHALQAFKPSLPNQAELALHVVTCGASCASSAAMRQGIYRPLPNPPALTTPAALYAAAPGQGKPELLLLRATTRLLGTGPRRFSVGAVAGAALTRGCPVPKVRAGRTRISGPTGTAGY